MSDDFAGDFILLPEEPAPTPEALPLVSSHLPMPAREPERPWRLPDFDTLKIENLALSPIVERCREAARRVFEECYEAGQPKKFCVDAAKTAYVSFMPSPVGEWDTRNFIACVAYGMLSHMIDAELGPRLLYAAQVALTGLSQKRKF